MTTAAGAAPADAKRFRIGGVITNVMRLWGRHIVVLVLLGVLIDWIPVMAFNYGAPPFLHRFVPAGDYRGAFGLGRAISDALISQTLDVSVALVVLSPATALKEMFGRVLGQIASVFPSIVLLSLFFESIQIIQALFLFSPTAGDARTRLMENGLWSFGLLGFMIFTAVAFGVASAVLAIERSGVLATLGRTFRLMSGHRWSFLGLGVICTIFVGVIAVTARAFLGRALTANPIVQAANLFLFSQLAVGWAMVIAVSYRELTRTKDGWRPADVADVFD